MGQELDFFKRFYEIETIQLALIIGIFIFIYQYYRKKLIYEREKAITNEQHTQELLNTKLEIQQQTMQDMGIEIHDNVGQRLTLASIYAHQLAFENKSSPAYERMANVGTIIDESLKELRALSKNLANANAEIGELKDLIINECNRVNALKLCTVAWNFNDSNFSMSTTIKNFILRIIQEFLQNSLKHSNCKNILLNFQYADSGLLILVKDDGKGFLLDSKKEVKKDGIGLQNMKKRAELIGAEFSLNSIVNKGTELNLFIPSNKLNFT